jgi:hypothetical protein
MNEAIKMFNPMVHAGFIQNMWHVPAICFVAVYNELCFLQCLYLPAQLHLAVEECLFCSFRVSIRSFTTYILLVFSWLTRDLYFSYRCKCSQEEDVPQVQLS